MFLFIPIATSILRFLDPAEAAKFLKEREKYVLIIKVKQFEILPLKVHLYKAIINH